MSKKNIIKQIATLTLAILISYTIAHKITSNNTYYIATNIYASTLEPVETTIATSTATPKTTAKPTNTPTLKPSPTMQATATPSATVDPMQITTPIEDTTQSPTPIPTFNLNQPGQVTPQGTTIPTAQPQNQGNNTAIIMGIIGAILIIIGLAAIILLRKKSNQQNMPNQNTPITPTPMMQQHFTQTTSQSTEQQFTTPYDQYIKNQNNN